MIGSSLIFPARKHLSFCLGSFILSFCSQYWGSLTAAQSTPAHPHILLLIRLRICMFLRSSHGQLPSTLCDVEYTIMYGVRSYGPGLKYLPPFDTLFLQSSHKASPLLHRLQIKIHANTWQPNLGPVDRYYNHQLNNDAFAHHEKGFTEKMQARTKYYSKLSIEYAINVLSSE